MKDVLGFREFLCPSSSSAPGAQPALNHKVHGPEPWKAMSPRSPGCPGGCHRAPCCAGLGGLRSRGPGAEAEVSDISVFPWQLKAEASTSKHAR